ncbi:MAG: hypothetical protein AAGU05_02660, partial [Anaerolineaceae bacterium]
MRALIPVLLVLIMLAACTPAAGQSTLPAGKTQSAAASPQPSTTAGQASAAEAGSPPSATDNETPPNAQGQPGYVEYRSGGLWLRLASPADEQVFADPEIHFTGQAPAGTVLSLNEEIILVEADERFDIPLRLEEGPN